MQKRLLALLEVADFLPAWNDLSLILGLEHTDDEELSSQWEDAYFGDDDRGHRKLDSSLLFVQFQSFRLSFLLRMAR
ncbi:hypothetical protein VN97_g9752 [Penicillium thymicola]|uniref:Uncharacterized protein n=1 Tax=Penicillium thymicola TaxID=293382 RepID=A0AAI9TAX0_PENTH|nr:hypothetical protein VN97_g9752 [Penicillium thymicola]